MNFVTANYMAYFCLGGACKAALSQISSIYLKCIPRQYKVQHSALLRTGIGSLLLEMREFVQLIYIYIYV